MSKNELKKESRKLMSEIEVTINSMEEEFQKEEDEFRKDLAAFHFGRLQQQLVNLSEAMGEMNGNK
jgi:hypothetical protein